MTTPLQKYKLTCWLFQTKEMKKFRSGVFDYKKLHSHHVKPKAKYPELEKDYKNIVSVPPILHAVLHHWLHQAYLDAGDNKDAKRFDVAKNIINYINEHDNKFEFNPDDIERFADTYWFMIPEAARLVRDLQNEASPFTIDVFAMINNVSYYTKQRKNNRIPEEAATRIIASFDMAEEHCKETWKTDDYFARKFAKIKKDMLDIDKNEIDGIIDEHYSDVDLEKTLDEFKDMNIEEQYDKMCKEIDDEKAAQLRDEKALCEETA